MNSLNSSVYVRVSQALRRNTGKELNAAERVVLDFIIERTLRYQKEEERIPYRHFLEGVVTADGVVIQAPVPVSKRTLVVILRRLSAMGLIQIYIGKDFAKSNFIKVAVDRIEAFLTMCALKVSKKYKNSVGAEEHQRGCRLAPAGGAEEHQRINKENSKQIEDKQSDMVNASGADDTRPVTDIIEEQQTESRKRRKRRAANNRILFTKTALRRVWNDAVADYAEEHDSTPITGMTAKDAGMIAKSVTNVAFFKGDRWVEYVQDVVVYWDDYATHLMRIFRSYQKVPALPSVAFFLKMNTKYFAPYYHARQTGEVDKLQRQQDNRLAARTQQLEKANAKVVQLETALDRLKGTGPPGRRELDHTRRQLAVAKAELTKYRDSKAENVDKDIEYRNALEDLPEYEEEPDKSRRGRRS